MKRVLLALILWSCQIFSAAQTTEQRYLEEFHQSGPSDDRKALVYLIVAQEFLNAGQTQKAREYYDLVLGLKTQEDKTRAYVQLIMLNYQTGGVEQVQPDIKNLYAYWDQNPQYQVKEMRVLFDELQSLGQGKFDLQRLESSYFTHLQFEQALKHFIEKKEYEKAFLLFKRERVLRASIVEQTLYDLLHVLVKGQHVDELICTVRMNKYPKAISYNLQICRILHQYIQGGEVDQSKLNDLGSILNKDYPEQVYLIEMVRSLKQ